MTRLELIGLLVGQARANGFDLRKWYCGRLGLPWVSGNHALRMLSEERRYYALLFSHDFAQSFWKPGEKLTFTVPNHTFQRTGKDGAVMTVTRKAYTRRSNREDSWKFHLREIAAQEEPLRYMRRYLKIDDAMEEDG